MKFEYNADELHHFGLRLAPEQRAILDRDDQLMAMTAWYVPDPQYFGTEFSETPLEFQNDDGTVSHLLLPNSFLAMHPADEDEVLEEQVLESGWDDDVVKRLPGAFGEGYAPWLDHFGCGCEECPGPEPVRLWGLWPIDVNQLQLLCGRLSDVFERSGWLNEMSYYRVLANEGYSSLTELEEIITAPIATGLPQKLADRQREQQHWAELAYESAQEFLPTRGTYKVEDFDLDLPPDLAEIWQRLQARRTGFLQQLPRVLPEHANHERLFVQWR